MRHLRSICLLLALTTVAPRAHAGEPQAAPFFDDGSSTCADELTHKGIDLAKRFRWAEAEKLFQQAWALKHSYDIGGNLGVTELALGNHRDAAEHLQFGFKTFPANGTPTHRHLMLDSLAKARAEVGALTIEVSIKGATVVIDGKEVGVSPMVDEVFVDPGPRTMEARLAGYTGAPQVVEVAKGTAQKVRLVLTVVPTLVATAVPMTRSNPPSKEEEEDSPRTGILVAGGGIAAAALMVGVVFTAVANGKASDADSLAASLKPLGASRPCQVSVGTCTSITTKRAAQEVFASAAVSGFIAAGAVAVGTAGYALFAPRRQTREAQNDASVRLAPMLTRQEGGVFVVGAW